MIHGSFPAMGTTIEVVATDAKGYAATQSLFTRVERRLSRFLSDSELTRVNQDLSHVVTVSPVLARVLACAADLRRRTGGLVDPAVGAAVVAWGYDRTFDEVDDLPTEPEPRLAGDWDIEGTRLTRTPGTRLDLGGIGKGWTADEAVDTGRALLVSAGGDVRSALPAARVEVQDPWGDAPATVALSPGGLATSSVTRRSWRAGNRPVHHLIDPATGAPATSPVLAATTRCPTAVESEAAAKAVLLHGDFGLAWADDQPWIDAAMVVWHTGSVFATPGWELVA
jgi:thiamine biosynthesis lipoprotein